ncbi:regulatory protein RecX [Halorhodospira halochloris]|uniref:regulatory protein RecX n=1 Tax=Halorhodospira halochloris TaxID=1052 RepID=UPI001EE7E68A|nr:regulatory protein RecX [Halorhodospira halochloris]MCG5548675.1 recombination regulator RecX [Halorhodospira halochloris]
MGSDGLIEQAREVAVRLLARREHTRRELDDKLTRRGFSSAVREQIVAEALEQGWLDEQRFAEAFVRSRVERGQGPLRLRSEMLQRGLPEELIDQAIEEYVDEHQLDWRELADQVRRKRFGDNSPQQRREMQRQAQFLQRRGFTTEQTRAAIGELGYYND